MSTRSLLVFIVAALLTGACTSTRTGADHDPMTNFSRYQTYQWVTEDVMGAASEQPRVSPLVQQRIRDAIDRALAAKGYKKAESADMAVSSTIVVRDDVRVTSWGPYGGYYYGHPRSYGYGWGWGPEVSVDSYPSSLLVINIFDATTKRPVWHGWASKALDAKDASLEAINETVSAILAQFPPGHSG